MGKDKEKDEEKNKPKDKLRAGLITLTVWENEVEVDGEKKKIPKFVLEKSYKKDDEWKTTNSLDLQDLPRATALLQKAYSDNLIKKQESKE